MRERDVTGFVEGNYSNPNGKDLSNLPLRRGDFKGGEKLSKEGCQKQ